MTQPSIAIFGDAETTGLKPVNKHLILEVGFLVVKVPEWVEIDAWSSIVCWDKHRILEACDDTVLAMHTKNGLLSEIFTHPNKGLKREAGGPPNIYTAHEEAVAFLRQYVPEGTRPFDLPELCGASPDFDLGYFEQHMPNVHKLFHYRKFDINAFWLLRKFMGEWDGQKQDQPHRVLGDCRRELQAVRDHFAWIGEALSRT